MYVCAQHLFEVFAQFTKTTEKKGIVEVFHCFEAIAVFKMSQMGPQRNNQIIIEITYLCRFELCCFMKKCIYTMNLIYLNVHCSLQYCRCEFFDI